ncbi:hypothetical protein [Mucisphaera calidilacus]|uniref:Methyltransferase n=1 Tax=Mucisphaera calidilacus TaxID=2527982 RepID=A0A518BY68_9BACT|nr:hypothetical protein [Mucisphaera calidilacus]QDU71912.1 hypothetical protein Pan265_17710 [Mucisphaera calidilacus]
MIRSMVKTTGVAAARFAVGPGLEDFRSFWWWMQKGKRNPPPPVVKWMALREYANRFGLKDLIETGTHEGNTLAGVREQFESLTSIELSDHYFKLASRRFDGDAGVTIVHGDSGKVLPGIVAGLTRATLFWLDGHYSQGLTARGDIDTPISQELESVLSDERFEHVALIDDARLFKGKNGYPTLDALNTTIGKIRPGYTMTVSDDIIRVHRQLPAYMR